MICAYYESEDGTEASFAPAESYETQPWLTKDVEGRPMKKLFEIEGADWTECCIKYHEHMGWEPYIPFDEREPNE